MNPNSDTMQRKESPLQYVFTHIYMYIYIYSVWGATLTEICLTLFNDVAHVHVWWLIVRLTRQISCFVGEAGCGGVGTSACAIAAMAAFKVILQNMFILFPRWISEANTNVAMIITSGWYRCHQPETHVAILVLALALELAQVATVAVHLSLPMVSQHNLRRFFWGKARA